jgi:hypothetical protein
LNEVTRATHDPAMVSTHLQPVGAVLEAGEQRIALRAGDIGDAPAHD